jgi:hypothetical protein
MIEQINQAIETRKSDGCVKTEFFQFEEDGKQVKQLKLLFPIYKDGKFFYFAAVVTGKIFRGKTNFTKNLLHFKTEEYTEGRVINPDYVKKIDFLPLLNEVKFSPEEIQKSKM